MLNTSVLSPLYTALVLALRGDVALQAWLHERPAGAPDDFARVYDEGTVPAELTGRWIALGDPSEQWRRGFARPGSSVPMVLHLWHTPVDGDDVGKGVSLDTWAHVARILSARLTLDGHRMLAGVASLTALTKDPNGESWHGIVQYDATTQVA